MPQQQSYHRRNSQTGAIGGTRREQSAVLVHTFDVPFDTPSSGGANQTAIRQCDAPVQCRQRAYGLPGEMGFGRGLLTFAHRAEFGESTGRQRKDVLRLPIGVAPTLEYPIQP